MTIKFVRSIIAVDSNGGFHAFSSENVLEVDNIDYTHGFKSIQIQGATIFVGEEPFAILIPEREPKLESFVVGNPAVMRKMVENIFKVIYEPMVAN